MSHSHYGRSVWHDFIRDTLSGMTLDHSAEKLGFSHQTAFNMRHKVLIALQDLISGSPAVLSRLVELDETFVLDCYKGAKLPDWVKREPRKHGAKAASPGISDEYVAICTAVQRDGGAVAMAVNRAKPSKEELEKVYSGHLEAGTVALTDGLRSYSVLFTVPDPNISERISANKLAACASFCALEITFSSSSDKIRVSIFSLLE